MTIFHKFQSADTYYATCAAKHVFFLALRKEGIDPYRLGNGIDDGPTLYIKASGSNASPPKIGLFEPYALERFACSICFVFGGMLQFGFCDLFCAKCNFNIEAVPRNASMGSGNVREPK